MPAPTDTTEPGTVTTRTTTTRTVEGHVWERSRKGVALPVAAGLLGLAALGLGQGWPARHGIESDLDERSTSALQNAGLSGIDVAFEGRDGVVTGSVASEADRDRILALVKAQTGVRVAVDRLTIVGAPGTGTEPGGTASPSASASVTESPSASVTESPSASVTESPSASVTESPSASATPSTGATAASARVSVRGGTVTLTGAVPDTATRKALVDAAAALVGRGKVVDRLTIDAGVSPSGLAGLAGVISALGKDADATITLRGGSIALAGTVASDAARTAALTAAEAVVGDAAKVRDGLTVRAPAPAPAPAGAAAARLRALPRITFETGSATLTPAGRAVVRRAAAILAANPGVRVEIQGHTDDRGTLRVNSELSAARARTVLLTLRGQGIARDRMTSKGFGETRPAAPNTTAANRALNRRVVFAVVR